jgi:GNAT superfamily N-acetyltransferase
MGGSDPDNVTGEVVEALLDERFSHLEVQVVVGQSNPHLQSIEAQIEGRGNFHVVTDVQNMAQLMVESDFAIGGGGSMMLERLYMELPSLVIPIAENQQVGFERAKPSLVDNGLLQFLPRGTHIISQSVRDEIHDRKSLTTQQVHVATSIGSQIESLCALFGANSQPATRLGWHLRQASMKDEDLLWGLFVDREVRDVALSHEPPDRAMHQKWLWKGLHHPSERLIFIAENEHGPVGQVRFNRTRAYWVIDIALTRQFRGRGYGSLLLQDAIESARQEGCHNFIALVRRKNTASRKLFHGAGFREAIEPAPALPSQGRLPPVEPDVFAYCMK